MAPVSSSKLLITGITGYIGFQTLIIALERGYNVRGVVRGDHNIADLRNRNPLIAKSQDEGRLDFAVVPEFLKAGEFVKALNNITVILHLAAPLAIQADDYDTAIIDPCVNMVKVVFEAAAQTPSVRRVVVTSSCVTLIPFEWNMNPNSDRLYTSADINSSPKTPYGSPMEAYWAAKAFARMASRNFIVEKKPHFDYVNLLPSVVIGADTRIPVDGSVAELLQGTRAAVMAPALDASLNSAFPYVGVPVHVHDVARAHVDAADNDLVPGNTEFILSSDGPEGVVWDRDITAIANKYFPGEVKSNLVPLEGSLTTIKWRIDSSETEKALGWGFTSFEETMKGMLAQYLQLKAIGKKQ